MLADLKVRCNSMGILVAAFQSTFNVWSKEMELSSMDTQKQTKSPDERLHDKEGGDVKGNVVYDNEPEAQKQAPESRQQDEQAAESFPASDTPVHSNPTSSPAPENKD